MRNLLIIIIANLILGSASFAQSPEVMRALETASVDELDHHEPLNPSELDIKNSYRDIRLKLFPNPVSELSTWLRMTNMPSTSKTIEIKFTDAFGSVIQQDKIKTSETFYEYRIGMLQRQNPGVYFVRVTVDETTFIEKLFIQ